MQVSRCNSDPSLVRTTTNTFVDEKRKERKIQTFHIKSNRKAPVVVVVGNLASNFKQYEGGAKEGVKVPCKSLPLL